MFETYSHQLVRQQQVTISIQICIDLFLLSTIFQCYPQFNKRQRPVRIIRVTVHPLNDKSINTGKYVHYPDRNRSNVRRNNFP